MSLYLDLKIRERTLLKRFDWNYIIVILSLQIIGLINLYSAAYSTNHLNRVFNSQLMWLPLAWFAFILAARINYKSILQYSAVIYGLNLGALMLVPFIGKRLYGARRWIDLFVFHYQPSETMKLSIILFLSAYLARNKLENFSFKDLIKPALIIVIPFLLTAKQPDLGTAILLLLIPASMLLFLKVRARVIISLALILAVSLPLAWS